MRQGLWFAIVSLCFVVCATAATGATAAATAFDDWPMFHHDAAHSGVSPETAIDSTTASSLGIAWQAATGGQVASSPAVVYNASLGTRVVYIGYKSGLAAYDASTGNRLWFYKAGRVTSSAAVDGNVVYFGSAKHFLYALDAATGKLDCKFLATGVIASSPTVANPDGNGKVVYFGDNGLTGSDDGGNVWAINAVDPNAATDCSLKWRFNAFLTPLAGAWSSPAYAVDSQGRSLIVIGTSSDDDAVEALDATTGAQVWRFQAAVGHDTDIGAGPTISAPGVNGFADGVAYVGTKYGIFYALNLRTGALLWSYNARPDNTSNPTSFRSTASLVGNTLYVGSSTGVYAFNATTGARIWLSSRLSTVSSPAITGAAGAQVLFVGDLSGNLHGLSLSDGSELWSYNTGSSYIYSSAAVSGGKMFIGTSNGNLLAFDLGGGVSATPDTTNTYPASGASLPNPSGSLTLTGGATDDTGVNSVMVSIHNGGSWWNAATQSWSSSFQESPATLGNQGSTTTAWSLPFAVPTAGGTFDVRATAIDADAQRDPNPASLSFFVSSLGSPPDTAITAPKTKQIFHFPVNPDGTTNYTIFPIAITGTATDSGGANPGVAFVRLAVRNIQHQEYYCGPGSGCPGTPGVYWRPQYTTFDATLDSPNATSTTWSASFPVYDHPHSYHIDATAIDRDGEKDTTKAGVGPICVNDPGVNTCP